VEKNIISQEKIDEALSEQKEMQNRRIGEIIAEKNIVSQEKIDEALSEQKEMPKRRVGEIIVEKNIISQEKIDEALSEQKEMQNRKIGEIIAEKHNISQDKIDDALGEERKQEKFMHVRIGEILLSNDLITREQLDDAIREQKSNKKMLLGEILIKRNIISEDELMMSLALKFRLCFMDLRDISPNQETLDMIPFHIVRKFRIFPISFDASKITIATYQLNDINCLDSVRMHTCRWVERVIAKSTQIEAYINKYYESPQEDINVEIEAAMSEIEVENQTQSLSLKNEAETAPIVRLSGVILMDGVKEGASDIHLLPQEDDLIVSFRVNGLLHKYRTLDKRLHKSLVARFKIIALMDIAEHRKPQDGRIRVKMKNRNIEFRVSCMPGLHGETLVLRILDKSIETVSLERLGVDPKDVKSINHIVRSSYGMLLVTGTTGSGKTTTLASILRDLADEPKHKISLEDPIETEIPGVNQIQIHDKIGFTFASALRNVLRHDPDIVMVGEIRDPETAKIAIQASLTGHVLISTLHTTKAVAAFSRLVDMGVESYLISATIKGVMAQQLLPRLCEKCRSTSEPTSKVLDYFAGNEIETRNLVSYVSTGCEHCRNSGISGRLLLYEFLHVNREMQRLITQMAPVETLREVASKSGMRSMVSMALEASQKGLISLDRIIPLLTE
jgi:type II secretory ATPase GspE/PulE/Tfp pilus assembly ATPase PilB-like protein